MLEISLHPHLFSLKGDFRKQETFNDQSLVNIYIPLINYNASNQVCSYWRWRCWKSELIFGFKILPSYYKS